MATELIKKLLEAGVHFGHQSRRWNPKMKKFIFGETYDKEIIDKIRSLVFCGKNMTTEAVFINVWTTIVAKFLPADVADVVADVV